MKQILIVIPLLLATSLACTSQQQDTSTNSETRGDIRVMFYNVENFFDTEDDSLTRDEEFLPGSDKDWTEERCWKKANQIFQTMAAVGEENPPEIVGFAEIENASVLQRVISGTPLSKYEYGIAHFESPDFRGIDVGLIYHKSELELLQARKIRIRFPVNPQKRTRDILYCSFKLENQDTLHVFVNHWPSRRGGEIASEPSRKYVATVLRSKVDSLFASNPSPNILIMGDFNDEPDNASIKEVLKAGMPVSNPEPSVLYNLSAKLQTDCNCGSYRYRADWNMLDQLIVSGALLHKSSTLRTCSTCASLADFNFLLTEDERYGGFKPNRTYLGPRYKGGFSDHLPVYVDLYFRN